MTMILIIHQSKPDLDEAMITLLNLSDRRRPLGLIFFLLFAVMLWLTPMVTKAGDVEAVLHSLDYIAVDYPGTVAEGKVINEAEYAEQVEFSQHLISAIPALPPKPERESILDQVQLLFQQIQERADGAIVAQTARNAGAQVAQLYQVRLTPRAVPDLQAAARLYRGKCASCHGAQGYGDGPAAKLDPPPINFHDRERAMERSVYGLYSAISLGVDGTGMRSFHTLSEGQRWALAFYVGSFAFSDAERVAGEQGWQQNRAAVLGDISGLTQLTPAAVEAAAGQAGLAQLAWLRAHPETLMQNVHPLDTAVEKLNSSIASYRSGNAEQAYGEAVAAYLDGFELAEASLRAKGVAVAELEQQMMAYRQRIKERAPLAEVESDFHALVVALDQARDGGGEAKLSGGAGAVSAAVILLREGLEAILILAAIAGVLIKTGRRDALPYLHAGWVAALALGAVTWWVSSYVVAISGANRELTEGITALLAAAVLVYVGFWLHGKTNAKRWREFVEVKIKRALQGRALWALTLVAFLAVYREVFETVLFYQALWLQTAAEQHISLWGGIAVGLATLLVLGWLILRFSMRLPLRLFFMVNSVILFVLAVAFSGHGVAALQEAGWIPVDPLPLPRVELLGLYPSVETILVQLLIGALIVAVLLRERVNTQSAQ